MDTKKPFVITISRELGSGLKAAGLVLGQTAVAWVQKPHSGPAGEIQPVHL